MKRRLGWRKPSEYAAEMGGHAADETSTDEVRVDAGVHDHPAAPVPEPAQEQQLRRRTDARSVLGLLVWLLFVTAAMFLAVGALLVALEADPDNGFVSFVLSGADAVDLGIFSRDNGLVDFVGENARTQSALVNWGLGAVAWLAVGRLIDRLLRP